MGENTYGHDTALCLLDAFYDEDAPGLDSTHGGTIDVHKVSTISDLATLLKLRLANVAVQGDILILCVDQAAFGRESTTCDYLV